ncbi:MAG: STAS domain-containing protein [Candidatus Riflebacteria bacterium]|nr:STAS domain-containing protein [Candidatus Riflebacteria bacterium]
MNVNVNQIDENGVLTISVEGSIDTLTASDFESKVIKALDGVKKLILDFAKVEYVSSAGLRTIILLNEKMEEKEGMTIKNINDEVRDVFEMTGFDELLTLE